MNPRKIYACFMDGMSIESIAMALNDEPGFIEGIIRAVGVGIEIGMATARWNQQES